eukprot:TRINITY_DN48533_c0_g1_i1.p1 TRINITY_DN48533_c0_g1~~TRINITY_DN48533_c0_g1_i1.p1  ORF type:complete len:152 (+),score=6.89 TRINITY_DN48533_c0_g1_i1:168-623(+)
MISMSIFRISIKRSQHYSDVALERIGSVLCLMQLLLKNAHQLQIAKTGTIRCFLSFLLCFCQFIMLNLFILIMITQFHKNYIDPNNPLKNFKDDYETFTSKWSELTYNNQCIYITQNKVVSFFLDLPKPFGFGFKIINFLCYFSFFLTRFF